MKSTIPIKIRNLRIEIQNIRCVTGAAGLAIGIYLLGTYLLSLFYHCGFQEVHIFSPHKVNAAATTISFLVFGAGFLMLYVIPGWIFSLHFGRSQNDLPVFLGVSFLSSILICILVTTIYKIIRPATGLDRINFLGLLMLSTVFELVSLSRKRHGQKQYPNKKLILSLKHATPYCGLILVAVLFGLTFRPVILNGAPVAYQYDKDMILAIPLGQQSDALEVFGLANSLRTHLLPYWDLEYANKFGYVFTDPPLYPYVSVFATLLFGENLAALSLLSLSFIVMMFSAVMAQGHPPQSKIRFLTCAGLMLAYLFVVLKEPAIFISIEHFFIWQILLAYIFLLRKNNAVFLLFAASTTMTRFYGILFILLGICALFIFLKERRREAQRLFFQYGGIVLSLLSFIFLAGVMTGDSGVYVKCLLIEHFNRFDHFSLLSRIYPMEVVYSPSPAFHQSVQFLRWTLAGTALLFPAFFVFGNDRTEKFYSFISLVYFALVFISTYNLPRYVLPLIPLTAAVVGRQWERHLGRRTCAATPQKPRTS